MLEIVNAIGFGALALICGGYVVRAVFGKVVRSRRRKRSVQQLNELHDRLAADSVREAVEAEFERLRELGLFPDAPEQTPASRRWDRESVFTEEAPDMSAIAGSSKVKIAGY